MEGDGDAVGDGDGAVFEDDGPLVWVVDADPGVGGVVRVPVAGDGEGEIHSYVAGGRKDAIGAITGDIDDLGTEGGGQQRGEQAGKQVFHDDWDGCSDLDVR